MAEYDFGDWMDYPDERDPISEAQAATMLADEMRREEAALSDIGQGIALPVSPPVMSQPVLGGPGVEDWRNYVQETMRDRGVMPLPSGVDYESQAAAEQARSKFEAQQLYNFYVNNGMAPEEALAQSGAGMFTATAPGAPKPMSAYQQAQVQRWQQPPQLTPYQQAQIGRWTAQDAAKAAKPVIAPGVSVRYKALIAAEQAAMQGDDPAEKNMARWARESFEKQHPELMGETTGTDTAGPVMPPIENISTPRVTGQKYPDGTRLRKSDGSIWVVRGGVPVRQ